MARPSKVDVKGAINGLRINQGITTAMLPSITFSPTLGITARRVDKLGLDIRSFREPLTRSIREVVGPSIRENFDKGGRPNQWDPLAADTPEIQSRIHNIGPHPILVRTGLMKRVMSQINIWTITGESAILKSVPSSIWYATVQQGGYGGNGAKKASAKSSKERLRENIARARRGESTGVRRIAPIPARPFVLLQSGDLDAINQVFEKWLGERVDRAWP
jgi:phage gpG-like protein